VEVTVSVRDGTIRDMGDDGIECSDPEVGQHVEGVRVLDNGGSGILLGARSTARYNIITGNAGSGITMGSESLLVHNVIVGNQQSGAVFGNESNAYGNVVSANGGRGLDANSGNAIRWNVVTYNLGDRAISAASPARAVIEGNSVALNSGFGIIVGHTANVIHNAVYDNGGVTTTNHGISTGNAMIIGNSVRDNAGSGIQAGVNASHRYNVLSANGSDVIANGNEIGCNNEGGARVCPP
jgi:hypothetical protein